MSISKREESTRARDDSIGPVRFLAAVRRCIVAAAAASSGLAYAGAEIATVTERPLVSSLRFRNLSVANGLPNAMTSGIRQDRDGYIWIGTYDGLAKYDGYEFTVVRDKLPDHTVTQIELDPSTGDLWVGTLKGLARVNPRTRKVFNYSLVPKGSPAPEGGEPTVLAIAVGDDASVWVGTNGYGLVRLDPKSGESQVLQHERGGAKRISFDTVTTLLAEKDKLWIGTGGAGIDVLSIAQRAVIAHYEFPERDLQQGSDVNLVQVLHRDRAGTMLVGTGSGLARLDEKTGTFKLFQFNDESASPSNSINDVLDGDDGKVWVATSRNLYLFDTKLGTSSGYAPDRGDASSLPAETLGSLLRDRENNIWVGTRDNGVGVFHPLSQYFTFYNLDVRAYFEDATGRMWIGAPSELCHAEKPHRLSGMMSCFRIGSHVRSIYQDEEGILWGGTVNSGLLRLDPKTGSLRFYEPSADAPNLGPNSRAITAVHGTRKGLWLGTFGGGLNFFDKSTGTFSAFTHDPNNKTTLSSDSVYGLAPTKHGDELWVATADGLDRFDPKTGRVTAVYRQGVDTSDPTNSNVDVVLTVYEAADGTLWVGTYGGGLKKIDPKRNQTQRYVDSEARGRNTVFGVVPDEGFLWLSTDAGVSRFDPKTGAFERYYPSDGLQGLAYTTNAFYKDATGLIYFGGINGMNVFRPSQIHREPYRAPLVVRRFQLDGKDVGADNLETARLSLSYSHKFLSFDFSILSYLDPEASQYMYRIEGLHDWVDIGNRHSVTLNTLPSGSYTLVVKGKSRTGIWNERHIPMHVSPPPWRTWWAYCGYGLIALGIAALIVRRQRKQVAIAQHEGRLAVVEQVLALTGAVQAGFLPENNEISTARLELFGFYQAADACSGDWWWHEVLSGGRHVILVGDVTGHGPGPAMVTAAVATAFRVLIGAGLDNIKDSLEWLNREVLRVGKGKYHMTMAALELDEATGRWILHSAGAPPMFSLNQAGKHTVHFCAGCPLGTETAFETGLVEGTLAPSDRLLLYTDGIPEIVLPNGNTLGMRRFAQLYERTRQQPLKDAASAMVQFADETLAGQAQLDDWTFTMIEWTGGRILVSPST